MKQKIKKKPTKPLYFYDDDNKRMSRNDIKI